MKRMVGMGRSHAEALRFFHQGHFDEAECSVLDLLREEPDHIGALNIYGAVLGKRRRWKEAIEIYERIFSLGGGSCELHHNVGNCFLSLGVNDKASDHFLKAIMYDENFLLSHINLGGISYLAGDFIRAAEWYRKACAIDPENFDANYNCAVSLEQAGQPDEALVFAEIAVKINPSRHDAITTISSILMKLERADEAVSILRRAISIYHGKPELHHELGGLYLQMDQYEDALRELSAASALSPDLARASATTRGGLHWMRRDFVEAENAFVSIIPDRLDGINIEVSSACNLKCPGCPRSVAVKDNAWNNHHMKSAAFRRIVEHLPSIHLCNLTWIGEPTLNPDLIDIVRIAKASRKFDVIQIITNAMVKDNDYYNELVSAGVDRLGVSLDSMDQDLAERTRSGTDFHRLIDAIFSMKSLDCIFFISYTLSKMNVHDMPTTLAALNNMGTYNVLIDFLSDYGAVDLRLDEDEMKSVHVMKDGFSEKYPNISISVSNQQNDKYCFSPLLMPAVSADGYLMPCCIGPHDATIMGRQNLVTTPYADIVEDEGFRNFVRSYLRQQPDFCRRCAYRQGKSDVH
ncbi:MAG: tetratricopeptide repeat protein [Alphaproteobacteria bacterium]